MVGVVDLGEAVSPSAKRAGMDATVKSSGDTSGTSSQVSGADTGAPGLARMLYGEAIVRSRAFWL